MSRLADFYASIEGKAFPYRVELTDAGGPLYSGSAPASSNDYNGFASNRTTQTPLSQREAPLHMQTYGGSQAVDWLMDAVNFVVEAAASADYHFKSGEKELLAELDPNDSSNTQLAPDDLLKLIAAPNPYMDWTELVELTLIDWLLVGNSYWVKWPQGSGTKPLALYRMCPEYVRIVPDQFGPALYVYRLPGTNADTQFTPDQVVHFKRPNPHSPFYGLGLVKGGSRALDMEIALTDTMASYYEKQALPSGVVQTERRVPKDVFNKLKNQLRAFYGGGRNAGQLMVLEAGLKYQTISPSAGDALFGTMGSWSRDRILAMFNLNKRLLGMSDDLALASGEMGDWQLLFDQKTMIPLCKRFSAVVSKGLTQPGWGVDLVIDYEETQQPDQVLKRAQTVAALPGVKVSEVRDAAGLPPTGDKDIDDFVLNLPSPNLDASGQGGAPDRNLLGEAGRPPIASNVPGFGRVKGTAPPGAPPASGASVGAGKKALDSDGNEYEILEGNEFYPGNSRVYGGYRPVRVQHMTIEQSLAALDRLADQKAMAPANVHVGEIRSVTPPQDTLADTRVADVDSLVAAFQSELTAASRTLERGLLDAAEGKAGSTLYQRLKNAQAWADFKTKLASILDNYVTQALSLANVHHTEYGLRGTQQEYADRADQIVNRPEGLSGIFDTLKSRLMAKVLDKQRKGADKVDVNQLIQTTIADWQTGNAQAAALTEATIAYNTGTLDVADANGHDVLVSDGDEDDDPCIEANGQTWPVSKARDNLVEHPRCRRAFVPVPAPAVS